MLPRSAAARFLATTFLTVLAGCAPPEQPLTGTLSTPSHDAPPHSISVGEAFGGALVDGVQMPESEHWSLVDPERAWGTHETVAFLDHAIRSVAVRCPSHKLFIGHISGPTGGPLWPHKSHQSGRDVDLSYYYRPEALIGWYQRANRYSLDAGRTWALLRTLIADTDVEYIFIDRRVQRLLRDHARDIGEDPVWLSTVFQLGASKETIVRHAWGHATHMHVRFYNRRAQALGAASFDELVASGSIETKRLRRASPVRVPPRNPPPSLPASAPPCGT